MSLLNIINDCIKELGKQDVKNCKQQIVLAAQNAIETIQKDLYLTPEEKFYRTNRVSQISNELLRWQDQREFLLDAAGFLNELSKNADKRSQ